MVLSQTLAEIRRQEEHFQCAGGPGVCCHHCGDQDSSDYLAVQR